MSNMTNETNLTNGANRTNGTKKPGGYRNLLVYQLAMPIYDLTVKFCKENLNQPKDRRYREQMEQAARSGKQNIVEASLEKSLKMNIKLTGVGRASFGELLEDYQDFLRVRGLKLWEKDNKRLASIRSLRIETNMTNLTNMTNGTDVTYVTNVIITLIHRENYLLDKMLHALEQKFIREGGYSEQLFKKRQEEKKRQIVGAWQAKYWG